MFAADDPAALAKAIADLFADRAAWPARKARARAFVEAERNWSLNISRYFPVYQRLAGAARASKTWTGPSPQKA